MTDDAHAMLVRAMTSLCLVCGFCVDSVSCDCLCGEAPSCRVLCRVFYLVWCCLWPLVSTYAERSDEPAVLSALAALKSSRRWEVTSELRVWVSSSGFTVAHKLRRPTRCATKTMLSLDALAGLGWAGSTGGK